MALIRGLGHNAPTAGYVNNVALTLLVTVDSAVAVMEGKDDDIAVLPSATHNRPINVIRFNPLFRQVCIHTYVWWLGGRVVSVPDSGSESTGSNRSRGAVE